MFVLKDIFTECFAASIFSELSAKDIEEIIPYHYSFIHLTSTKAP